MKNIDTILTLVSHGTTYQITHPYSDVSLDELVSDFKKLLYCAGYAPQTIEEVFNEE